MVRKMDFLENCVLHFNLPTICWGHHCDGPSSTWPMLTKNLWRVRWLRLWWRSGCVMTWQWRQHWTKEWSLRTVDSSSRMLTRGVICVKRKIRKYWLCLKIQKPALRRFWYKSPKFYVNAEKSRLPHAALSTTDAYILRLPFLRPGYGTNVQGAYASVLSRPSFSSRICIVEYHYFFRTLYRYFLWHCYYIFYWCTISPHVWIFIKPSL